MKKWCVYCHTFPNGKRYVGITCNTGARWRRGNGYKGQTKVWRAIEKYGWDNIKHDILKDGLTKEQAVNAEKQLIQDFDSINNGYNVSIGGDEPLATYLDPYVLAMIRAVKKFFGDGTIADVAYYERTNEEAAGFWNEASRAVTMKHKQFSATDEKEVSTYWFHMAQYEKLWERMEAGDDVTSWVEESYEQAILDYFQQSG